MEREIEIFNNYYSNYDDSVDAIHRKYEHTFRVVEYAERVARSLDLSEDDVRLACICALFHDIGRFPQWAMYQTYEDGKSLDHGDKSAEILDEIGYDDEIVRIAVKYHNKYAIPEYLSDREKLFLNITRDADKLDIMVTQGLSVEEDSYFIRDEVQDDISHYRLVRNGFGDDSIYHIYRQLSFIFDTVYKESFKIINEKNLINSKFDLLASKFGEDVIKDNRKLFNDYINERIG